MTNTDFTTSIEVSQSAQEVYRAINNVKGWWQGKIIGETDKVNEAFSYEMPGHHLSVQKIIALQPNHKIVWQVVSSDLPHFNNPNEWTGTTITFDIIESNNKTIINFMHAGLTPDCDCYNACSNGWSLLIQKSLFSLITKGIGVKVFGE